MATPPPFLRKQRPYQNNMCCFRNLWNRAIRQFQKKTTSDCPRGWRFFGGSGWYFGMLTTVLPLGGCPGLQVIVHGSGTEVVPLLVSS